MTVALARQILKMTRPLLKEIAKKRGTSVGKLRRQATKVLSKAGKKPKVLTGGNQRYVTGKDYPATRPLKSGEKYQPEVKGSGPYFSGRTKKRLPDLDELESKWGTARARKKRGG
jgi:hypothetical protein